MTEADSSRALRCGQRTSAATLVQVRLPHQIADGLSCWSRTACWPSGPRPPIQGARSPLQSSEAIRPYGPPPLRQTPDRPVGASLRASLPGSLGRRQRPGALLDLRHEGRLQDRAANPAAAAQPRDRTAGLAEEDAGRLPLGDRAAEAGGVDRVLVGQPVAGRAGRIHRGVQHRSGAAYPIPDGVSEVYALAMCLRSPERKLRHHIDFHVEHSAESVEHVAFSAGNELASHLGGAGLGGGDGEDRCAGGC